jgi:hypothetical protein
LHKQGRRQGIASAGSAPATTSRDIRAVAGCALPTALLPTAKPTPDRAPLSFGVTDNRPTIRLLAPCAAS